MLCDGEHPIELRYRLSESEWRKRWADTPAEADELAARLTRRADVYVGVLPRLGRDGEDQCRYAPARVLWADCDSDRSARKLALFEPTATAVIHSGGMDGETPRRYGWWALSEPLPADDVRRHTLRIAHHLEADVASCEPARVLRVPGSRSHKTGRIATLETFTGEVHELVEITGDLDDAPTYVAGRAGVGEHEAPAGLVPHGERDPYLFDFGVRFLRGGFLDRALIVSHLELEFRRACAPLPPPTPGYFERMAGSLLRTRIADRERAVGDLTEFIRKRRGEES